MSFDNSLQRNILIKLLKVITNDEWKEFEKFVTSPFFNEGRNYLPLLKILKKFHPSFDSPDFTKEKMYTKLFPGKEYKESVLSSMFSRLYNIGEEYMIHLAVKKDTAFLKQRLIIKELRSRGVMLKLNKTIEKSIEHYSKKKFDDNDLRNIYEINIELNKLNQANNQSEIFYKSVYEVIRYSIFNFLYEINLYLSAAHSLQNYWKENFSESYLVRIFECIDIGKVFDIIKKEDPVNYSPVRLVWLSYMATRYPEKNEYYFEMKELLNKDWDSFERSFRELIITNMSSICSMKLLKGDQSFKMEAFELRVKLFKENLYGPEGDYMKVGDLRSMFLDAINVGEISYAKEFADKFIVHVHPEFRSQARYFCDAWLSLFEGDYDATLENANKVDIDQITFKLDIKNIVCRVYYSTNSIEPLLSLLNTYYQLVNNSISKNKDYLNRHRNFIKFMRKLVLLKEKNKKDEIGLLLKQIEKENVSGKSWLVKNVREAL